MSYAFHFGDEDVDSLPDVRGFAKRNKLVTEADLRDAASGLDLFLVDELLSARVDPNAADFFGRTPILLACGLEEISGSVAPPRVAYDNEVETVNTAGAETQPSNTSSTASQVDDSEADAAVATRLTFDDTEAKARPVMDRIAGNKTSEPVPTASGFKTLSPVSRVTASMKSTDSDSESKNKKQPLTRISRDSVGHLAHSDSGIALDKARSAASAAGPGTRRGLTGVKGDVGVHHGTCVTKRIGGRVGAGSSSTRDDADDVIELLLGFKANPSLSTKNGDNALHVAAARKDPGLALRLLAARANPNATNTIGWTPLHIACDNGDENTVAVLVGGLLNVSVLAMQHLKTADGHTPSDLVRRALEQRRISGDRCEAVLTTMAQRQVFELKTAHVIANLQRKKAKEGPMALRMTNVWLKSAGHNEDYAARFHPPASLTELAAEVVGLTMDEVTPHEPYTLSLGVDEAEESHGPVFGLSESMHRYESRVRARNSKK